MEDASGAALVSLDVLFAHKMPTIKKRASSFMLALFLVTQEHLTYSRKYIETRDVMRVKERGWR